MNFHKYEFKIEHFQIYLYFINLSIYVGPIHIINFLFEHYLFLKAMKHQQVESLCLMCFLRIKCAFSPYKVNEFGF
jgi:hypothetical protein